MGRRGRFVPAAAIAAALTLLLSGCATGGEDAERPAPAVAPVPAALVAQSRIPSIPVFEAPGAPTPKLNLASPNEDGATRVFLVKSRRDGWLEVLLPVRPNGSRGWIKESDVTLGNSAYRVKVELGAHHITVWNGATVIANESVGVGKKDSPTPGGEYFITVLIKPPKPDSVYGAYAFGLSGYSNVYQSFAGGTGVVGLHGTNDPSGLGKDVSAGCIRMNNETITRLASLLPLGTPVEIMA